MRLVVTTKIFEWSSCGRVRISKRNFSAAVSKPAKTNAVVSSPFIPVIGLEIHAQIDAKTKLFSNAASTSWALSNTTVSFFDAALPGTLPVLNKRCVVVGIAAALALNCRINNVSYFDRKHYFYSDLPTGYQITQQRRPLAVDGWLEYVVFDEKGNGPPPYVKRTAIKQIQLEQDSGKSIHDAVNGRSLIDLNRAGVALLEIVCHHDMENEVEAACFAKELHAVLRKIEVCEGKLERGQFRVDANISIHQPDEPLGPRTEVKNLNSFRFVRRALEFEIARQIELRKSGKPVINETLTFDYRTGKTSPMRDKEVRQDYRYMPEPNLPPLKLKDTTSSNNKAADRDGTAAGIIDINEIRNRLPELPAAIREMRVEKYGLSLIDCVLLSSDDVMSKMFNQLMAENQRFSGPTAVRTLTLYKEALDDAKSSSESRNIELAELAEIAELLDRDRISERAALTIMLSMAKGYARSPLEIIEERNLFALDDEAPEIELACCETFQKNPSLIKRYKNGEKKVFKKLFTSVASKLNWRYPEKKLERIVRAKLTQQ